MEHIIDRTGGTKAILLVVSILGLIVSGYGYYELLTVVPVFADIFSAFGTSLSQATLFIIQTHYYYGVLSLVGVLGLALVVLNKASVKTAYLLALANILLMVGVRWLVANQLHESVSIMGIIQ